ncbi:S41 family peptidase [uncultured Dialister sp.]|jgi:carboxyl-terminal processing protease|uniref:S41 family peptidase n=1 Tax=uncultured Dialister sp. TaxID=278064 RepID=UPI0025E7AEE8|nr:S41 family peptidase [uncultured Dialister sp.]
MSEEWKSFIKAHWKMGLSYIGGTVLLSSAALFGGVYWLTGGHPGGFYHFLHSYRIVKDNYFRPIDENVLWQGASKGMLASLEDPYSTVLAGDTFNSFMETTNGEYGGIGVVMGLDGNGSIRIFNVFEGSAAEKAGIQSGDTILSVDGTSVDELSLTGTAQAVRGENGTEVNLAISRNGKPLTFTVNRSNVSLPTVLSRMVEGNIGYIHIFTFSRHTPDEFKKQLSTLKDQGCEKLIIDLRMNPGGMIDSVVAVADQILTGGTVVSYHTMHQGSENFTIKGIDNPMPMTVLIDKNSASASEILAGAVQDKKEGTIIGETSYGKGTVQAVYPDGNREALKISIAEYRTAAGRIIDKKGIVPDIPVEQTGHPFSFSSDNVLQKAVDVLKNEGNGD